MQLDEKQRATLREVAAREGLDADELIASVEGEESEDSADSAEKSVNNADKSADSAEQPKLFMYHLPFVRVREVRQVWLGLTEAFPGDDEVAAEWAAKFSGGSAPATPPDEAA